MAKWIVAENPKAGLRHAVVVVVWPNVTRRTKKGIAQKSKRARAGLLALVDYSHKWRELVSPG